jgi:DNA-binding NarL/FixJ family response regulator
MITVLLVDDQPLIRLGFRMVLGSAADVEIVGEAEDGQTAVEMTRDLDPDVVLMDIRMPRLDGIQATRMITASAPRSKVLILTTFDLDEYAFSALNAGASGFLLKDADPAELIGAVRTISRGDAVIAPRMTRRLLDTFAKAMPTPARQATVSANLAKLTPRELEVLTEVAAGLSNSEIADRLTVAETTVKTHLGRILTKLELRDRVQAVVFAYQNGLVHST